MSEYRHFLSKSSRQGGASERFTYRIRDLSVKVVEYKGEITLDFYEKDACGDVQYKGSWFGTPQGLPQQMKEVMA